MQEQRPGAAARQLAGDAEDSHSYDSSRQHQVRKFPEEYRTVIKQFSQRFEAARAEYQATPPDGLGEEEWCRRLLAMRLPDVQFCRCCVGESVVHGRGLFSTRDLAKGELISFYPGDALIYFPEGDRSTLDDVSVTFGAHVPEAERDEEHVLSDESRAYEIRISAKMSIVGDPRRCDDAAYLAHMCNDADTCASQADEARYERESPERSNAEFIELEGCLYLLAATKPIPRGSEVFVSYGAGYWCTPFALHLPCPFAVPLPFALHLPCPFAAPCPPSLCSFPLPFPCFLSPRPLIPHRYSCPSLASSHLVPSSLTGIRAATTRASPSTTAFPSTKRPSPRARRGRCCARDSRSRC